MNRRHLATLTIACWLLLPAMAGAQEASPPALATPAPSQCTVAPRSVEEIEQIAGNSGGTPAVELGTPNTDTATPTPFVAPEGTPITGDDAAPIADLVTQFYACQNANDNARMFALMTDELVARTVQEGMIDPADLVDTGTPAASTSQNQRAIAINGIIQIEPEVYGVNVIGVDQNGEEFTDYLVVTGSGDNLRIDDIVALTAGS